MRMFIVSVYDVAVGAFGRPSFVQSVGAALRSFGDEVNRKGDDGNMLNSHPADFQLFKLGEFDDSDGSFTCPDRPEKIADAVTLKIEVQS